MSILKMVQSLPKTKTPKKNYGSGAEMTFDEIGTKLGIKKGAAMYAYHTAIEKIKKNLGEERLQDLLEMYHASMSRQSVFESR